MRGGSGHELLPVVPVAGLGLPGLEPVRGQSSLHPALALQRAACIGIRPLSFWIQPKPHGSISPAPEACDRSPASTKCSTILRTPQNLHRVPRPVSLPSLDGKR